ncbi:Protein FAM151B [Microtus ochrogaster]|uniref:Protein FAM151B n=1 Tax=Microtus ochrogaster TaxID=79684 RepID=A0A8J6KP31_MICOH|nr:Protein FAM151B [Microtus ochrogaster]
MRVRTNSARRRGSGHLASFTRDHAHTCQPLAPAQAAASVHHHGSMRWGPRNNQITTEDGAEIVWYHAANHKSQMREALRSAAHMIEADVLLPSDGSEHGQPIMAHPPETHSDNTLQEWLAEVIKSNKGIKLDFKRLQLDNGERDGLHMPWADPACHVSCQGGFGQAILFSVAVAVEEIKQDKEIICMDTEYLVVMCKHPEVRAQLGAPSNGRTSLVRRVQHFH